jgi:hypothetical protein
VQSADKAKTVKYTLNDQYGAAAEVDACRKLGPVAAGAGAHFNATYSNQIQYTADTPVYFEASLKTPLPTGVRMYVDLNAQPTAIPNTYPSAIFSVSGPLPPVDNPSYTLTVGPDPIGKYTFFESQMGWPQRLDIGGVPFLAKLYRDPNHKLAIEFTQAGLPTSVTTASSAGSSPAAAASSTASNPPPAASGPAPQTGSACSASATGSNGTTPAPNPPKPAS